MEPEHLIQKNLGSGRCNCIISGWEEVGLLAELVYITAVFPLGV